MEIGVWLDLIGIKNPEAVLLCITEISTAIQTVMGSIRGNTPEAFLLTINANQNTTTCFMRMLKQNIKQEIQSKGNRYKCSINVDDVIEQPNEYAVTYRITSKLIVPESDLLFTNSVPVYTYEDIRCGKVQIRIQ